MSDKTHQNSSLNSADRLFICLFSLQESLADSTRELLASDRYSIKQIGEVNSFVEFVRDNQEEIDCIIFVNSIASQDVLSQLWELKILLPIIILEADNSEVRSGEKEPAPEAETASATMPNVYHSAEIKVYPTQLTEINSYINLAITKFLNLAPNCDTEELELETDLKKSKVDDSLILQQRRLAEKLKERLGYLGVYYKRNSRDFYRHLSSEEKAELLEQLASDYRQIILNYFKESPKINQFIDNFVDRAFFADISISQVLEIHMELMDEFAQQLQIEGRSEEILLDYRLALIDIIAHLCEMYRRSIPGRDVSLELLFRVE